HVDLIVRNARLADLSSGDLIDIGVEQGRIVALEHALAGEAEVYDAKGCLACPGLTETHIHLDKSRIIDRCAPQERKTLSPVKGVSPPKESTPAEHVPGPPGRPLKACTNQGPPPIRPQVKSDPAIGMRGFEGVQSLIADYKWAIDIEICVFPQEGLTNY